MAKNTDKKKKDSDNKKTSDNKASRGRPSSKEEKIVADKTESTKAEPKKEPVKVAAPIKPQISETDLLTKEIYGDEPLKDAIPFPKSEQKTQTISLVDEYNIDVQRLPSAILNLINDFVSDFTTLTQNPMMIALVSSIIQKDSSASNSIREWVEPRKDKLIALKIKVKGGVSVVKDDKTVSNAQTTVNQSNTAPTNVAPPPTNTTQQQPQQQQVAHGENPLIPRQPTGSYQHHIHSNPAVAPNPLDNNRHISVTENKDIHYEMLNKSNHFADVHKQQNLQYVPEQIVPVAPEQYIQNYADSIMASINGGFQMIHWGYIPLDTLKDILARADNSFGYEIVQSDEGSYINVSRGGHKVATPRFQMK